MSGRNRHRRPPAPLPTPSAYDAQIIADGPVLFMPLHGGSGGAADRTGNGHSGQPKNNPALTTFLNGDKATVFDGQTQYIEVPDHDDLSVTTTGALTIEAWMRPDVLTFPHYDSTGYVHWMGKTGNNQNEYVSRMYNASTTDSPPRPNRISGYAYNASGGLGTGSYFQDPVNVGDWIHYALVINIANTSSSYPQGYTKIYKNSVLRDTDDLTHYNILPSNGTAPFRVGSVNLNSYFQGAVAKVAIYNYELSPAVLRSHYEIIVPPVQGTSAFVKNVGSASTTTTGTTLVITVTNKVSAGNTLIARVAHDYGVAATISDSQGNTWTADRTVPDSGTTMRVGLYSCQVISPLMPGDTIQLTTPNVAAKAFAVDEFSHIVFTGWLDKVNNTNGTSTTPTQGTGIATTQADDLLIGVAGVKGPNTDSYTEANNLAWSSLARIGTNSGVSDVTVNSAYKVVGTTATYKYLPTLGTSRVWASIIGAYKAGTPVYTPPATGTTAYIQNVASGNAQTAGTTLVLTTQVDVPAGHTLIIRAINDNTAASISASDSKGNTYTRDKSAPNDAATMRAALLSSPINTPLVAGDTITITMSNSTNFRMATVDEFANVIPNPVDATNSTSTTNSSPTQSVTTTNADDLIVSMVAVPSPVSDVYTEDTANKWISLQRTGTSGFTINGAYKSPAANGTYTYHPTLAASASWIELLGAYKAGTPTIITPPSGTAHFVKSIGTSASTAASNTLTITVPAGGVTAGHTLIVKTLHDFVSNNATINDSRGNSYTRDRTSQDSTAVMRMAVFSSPVGTALQAGDSITVTFPAGTTAKAVSIDEFSSVLTPIVVDGQYGASNAGVAPNAGFTTTTANDLLVGVVGVAGDVADTYTEDSLGSWTGLTRVGTTGGTYSANRTINSAYRVVGATGNYHYQPSLGTSATWIDFVIAYRGA